MRLPSLLVAAVLGVVLLPATPAAADYRQVVDITFPTERGATYIDDYDHVRSGDRAHRATDVFGPKMSKVYAAVGGEITAIPGADGGPKPWYGYMITIAGDDGRRYHYVHLNDDTPGTNDAAAGPEWAYAPGLRKGSVVTRGQWIGYLGDSGNAKGAHPHLHFQIQDPNVSDPYGSDYINPYASLRAAEERGDYAASERGSDGEPAPVDRIAGPDRVATALALSRTAYDSARRIILAPARSFPEAAAAGPLGAARGEPVLVTWSDSLDDRVAAEIRRLGANAVTLIGGLQALSDRVVAELVAKAGIPPDGIARLHGTDRYRTAVAVAEAVWTARGNRSQAVVALGEHPDAERAWPDALTSAWYGAVSGGPVLLVQPDRLPEVTAEALDGVDTAVIVGGPAAIPDGVVADIAARARLVRRLAGGDRYTTAAAVASDLIRQEKVSRERLWAATGRNWADALAAAAVVSRSGEVLMLIDGEAAGADASIERWLATHRDAIAAGRVIGGTAAITDEAMALLAERLS